MRRLSLCLLLLLLAACGRPASPASAPPATRAATPASPAPAPEAAAGPILTLEPAAAPPGATVTLTVRFAEPEKVPPTGPGGSWYAALCWDGCAAHQWQGVPFRFAPDGRLLTAQITVPRTLGGAVFTAGPHQVTIACRTKLCEGVPEAEAAFTLTDALPVLEWALLPRTAASPVPALGAYRRESVNPADPQHRAVCEHGVVTAQPGAVAPRIRMTADGGGAWQEISLKGVRLGSQSGMAGCRAFALDPRGRDVFYLAGGGHRAAHDWSRDPPPLFTPDAGQTWLPVPLPTGYDLPDAFLGYSASATGVTAWFARAEDRGAAERSGLPNRAESPASVAGQYTADGGRTWQEVPLGCPPAGPCLWEAPMSLFLKGYRGVWRSDGQAGAWHWAQWAGAPFHTLYGGIYRLDDGSLEVTSACAEGPECVPLLRSTDGGQTWTAVQVPPPPGGWGQSARSRLAADGAMLVERSDAWHRLERGAGEWQLTSRPANP